MRSTLAYLLLIAFGLAAGGCSTEYAVHSRLDNTLTQYTDLLERSDYEGTSFFAAPAVAEEYQWKVEAAKNVQVLHCQTLRVNYDEPRGVAEVLVEIEYYSLRTLKVRTIRDNQRWIYVKGNGSPQWKLMTPLPDFP